MAESITNTLLALQVLMHVAIAIRLLLWNEPGRKYTHRPWVSRFAFLLAGSSAANAMHVLTSWNRLALESAQPWHVIFVAIVLVGIFKARGNLAYFLPR